MTESTDNFQEVDKQNRSAEGGGQPSDHPQAKRRWFGNLRRNKAVVAQPTTSEEEHRATERDYWRRSLRKQRNLNVITFLAAIAGLAGIWVLWGTLKTAKDQATAAKTQTQTAQQEFELSERPWVYFANVALVKPLTYDPNGAQISLQFSLKNIGHSPAAATWINLTAFAEHAPDFITEQKKLCDPIRSYPPSSHAIGYTIFPGQEIVLGETVYVPRKQIEAEVAYWTNRFKNAKGKTTIPLFPVVVGCVDYRFEFAPGHHQTPFVFTISRRNPKYPDADFVLEPYKTISLANLKLEQWFEAGSDAD